MIRPIMTKKIFLRQPSEQATAEDLAIGRNLIDSSRRTMMDVLLRG